MPSDFDRDGHHGSDLDPERGLNSHRDAELGAVGPRLALLRLIFGCLMAGLVVFGGIALAFPIGSLNEAEQSETVQPAHLLMWVALAVTATTALPAGTIGKTLGLRSPSQFRELTTEKRFERYQGAKILTGALIEGPGLLWCVLAMLTGNIVYLSGAAFCVLLMLIHFPSLDQYEEWSAAQQ